MDEFNLLYMFSEDYVPDYVAQAHELPDEEPYYEEPSSSAWWNCNPFAVTNDSYTVY